MRLFTKPTRDPLPADYHARVLAHYLTLALLGLIFLVGTAIETPTPPAQEVVNEEPKSDPWYEQALDLIGKLL